MGETTGTEGSDLSVTPSGEPPKRARRGRPPQITVEERRQRLVDAAFEVAGRDGVMAMTTRAVTKQAGMPHGAFHYVFDGKAALIRAMFRDDSDAALSALWSAVDTSGTPEEVLLQAGMTAWQAMVSQRSHQSVLMQLSFPPLGADEEWHALAETARTISIRMFTAALTDLAAAMDHEWTRDLDWLGSMLYYQMDLAIRADLYGGLDPKDLIRLVCELLVGSLRPLESPAP